MPMFVLAGNSKPHVVDNVHAQNPLYSNWKKIVGDGRNVKTITWWMQRGRTFNLSWCVTIRISSLSATIFAWISPVCPVLTGCSASGHSFGSVEMPTRFAASVDNDINCSLTVLISDIIINLYSNSCHIFANSMNFGCNKCEWTWTIYCRTAINRTIERGGEDEEVLKEKLTKMRSMATATRYFTVLWIRFRQLRKLISNWSQWTCTSRNDSNKSSCICWHWRNNIINLTMSRLRSPTIGLPSV